jgi:hypothetical protein
MRIMGQEVWGWSCIGLVIRYSFVGDCNLLTFNVKTQCTQWLRVIHKDVNNVYSGDGVINSISSVITTIILEVIHYSTTFERPA